MAARTGPSASSSEEKEAPKEETSKKQEAPEVQSQEGQDQEALEKASEVANPELEPSSEPIELPEGWTPDTGTIPGDFTVANYVVAEEDEEVPESKES